MSDPKTAKTDVVLVGAGIMSATLGVLDFGTTVLCAADGTIAGLLGASPEPRLRCLQ